MSAYETSQTSSASAPGPVRTAARQAFAVLFGGILLLAACDRQAGSGSASAADTAADAWT